MEENNTKLKNFRLWFENHRLWSILLLLGVSIVATERVMSSSTKIASLVATVFKGAPEDRKIDPYEGGSVAVETNTYNGSSGNFNILKSVLDVDVVSEPKIGDQYFVRHYEIHVSNPTEKSLLLKSAICISDIRQPKGEGGQIGGPQHPNGYYELEYQLGGITTESLIPPYRIPAGGSGAFRITLMPQTEPEEWMIGMNHLLTLYLEDSDGNSLLLLDNVLERTAE